MWHISQFHIVIDHHSVINIQLCDSKFQEVKKFNEDEIMGECLLEFISEYFVFLCDVKECKH